MKEIISLDEFVKKSGFTFRTADTDILEYCVFENAGVLADATKLSLVCRYRQGDTSNILFFDNKLRSSIMIGTNVKSEKSALYNMVNKMVVNVNDTHTCIHDREYQYYKKLNVAAEYAIIVTDDYIKEAITHSSLLKAIKLTTLSPEKKETISVSNLINLIEATEYYRITDTKISSEAKVLKEKLANLFQYGVHNKDLIKLIETSTQLPFNLCQVLAEFTNHVWLINKNNGHTHQSSSSLKNNNSVQTQCNKTLADIDDDPEKINLNNNIVDQIDQSNAISNLNLKKETESKSTLSTTHYNKKIICTIATLGILELAGTGCAVGYSNTLIAILGGSLFLLTMIGAVFAYKNGWLTTNDDLDKSVHETRLLQ